MVSTHLSNYKMSEVLSDIRKFLEDDFRTDSATPTLEREPKVVVGDREMRLRSRKEISSREMRKHRAPPTPG